MDNLRLLITFLLFNSYAGGHPFIYHDHFLDIGYIPADQIRVGIDNFPDLLCRSCML